MHADQKLYLVFEFLDVDLKRYMEAGNSQGTPLSLELCQVRVPCSIFFSHLAAVNTHLRIRNADCPLIGVALYVRPLDTLGADGCHACHPLLRSRDLGIDLIVWSGLTLHISRDRALYRPPMTFPEMLFISHRLRRERAIVLN